jgi:hypothetical protein
VQSLVLEIVNAHRAQLQGLIEIGGVRKLAVLYERAQQELEARLAGLLRAGQGQTFQAHHLRMVLVQVQDALRGFKSGFAAHLRDTSEMAATLGGRHLVGAIKKLERRFSGVEPVLRVEEAGVFQGMYAGIEPSLLARHNHLVARYPLETIRRVEGQLSQSLLANETVDQATNRIIGAGGIFGRERYRAERIIRCLPGETTVTGAVVRAVWRRWYDGDLVRVITERGHQISATPNHPMLTTRGWIPQDRIVPGDYLIGYRRKQDLGATRNENITRRPTTLAEIFDATSAVGVVHRRRTAEPDFHGDGREGDVDVACPERELMFGIFAPLTQPAAEQFFSPSDGANKLFCPKFSHLLPYQRACLCSCADGNSSIVQTTVDADIVYAKHRSNCRRALSRLVSPNDFIDGEVAHLRTSAVGDEIALGVGESAHDARAMEVFENTCLRHSEFDCRLSSAEPGDIELDRVVDSGLRKFSGHVYNLSTPDGYYTIDDIYTGNTESAYAYGVTQQASGRELLHQIPKLHKRLVATFDQRTGEDSKKLNGQTVPWSEPFVWMEKTKLGEKRIEYMMPPNRPQDREVVVPWRPEYGMGKPPQAGPVTPRMPSGL